MGGPIPGSTCTVCNSPKATLVNDAIRSKQPDRAIARAFGFGRGVIQHHRATGHPGVERYQATREFEPDREGTPREKLQAVIDQLERQAAGATLKVDLARELRIAYADLDKMGGGAGPTEVTMADVAGLAAFLRDCLAALEPFPEARLAMAAVLARHPELGEPA